MLLNVIITLFFTALAFTVAIPGYNFTSKYVLYADYFESLLLKWLQFFVGMFIYLGANVISLGLLANNFEKETWKSKHEEYARGIFFGLLREEGVQTNSNLNETKLNYATSSCRKITKNESESPHLLNRAISSTPALHFNSFNFDRMGLLVSYDKFQVCPESCSTTFKDIAGLEELKTIARQRIIEPFASVVEPLRKQARAQGFDVLRSILLIGERGSGKSSIVEAVFNELRGRIPRKEVRFYKIDGSNCIGPFIGSGLTFRDIFHFAQEASPASLLLFDNIERLHDRSASIFLSELASVPKGKMLVFATTSDQDRLHERLQFNDDFDMIYVLQPPTLQERTDILKLHFQRRNCSIEERYLVEFAQLTDSYSGGELEKVVSMVNSKLMETYYRAYQDVIQSTAKPKKKQQGNILDIDVPTKDARGTSSSFEFKQVSRHQLLEALEKFEQLRWKRQPFITGHNNNNLTFSKIM